MKALFSTVFLVWFTVAIVVVVGWVKNILNIVYYLQSSAPDIDITIIAQLVGVVVVPLGAILGYVL
jgi:hypothetical protein